MLYNYKNIFLYLLLIAFITYQVAYILFLKPLYAKGLEYRDLRANVLMSFSRFSLLFLRDGKSSSIN